MVKKHKIALFGIEQHLGGALVTLNHRSILFTV